MQAVRSLSGALKSETGIRVAYCQVIQVAAYSKASMLQASTNRKTFNSKSRSVTACRLHDRVNESRQQQLQATESIKSDFLRYTC